MSDPSCATNGTWDREEPWACVCGWWHESAPHVLTDQLGNVLHAPVAEAEEVLSLP